MTGPVADDEAARGIAREFASENCVGKLGEVLSVSLEGGIWIVEFRTHTFNNAYVHHIEFTEAVGNVFVHEKRDEREREDDGH